MSRSQLGKENTYTHYKKKKKTVEERYVGLMK